MFSGVGPQCRPCLWAWYITIGHACGPFCTSTSILSSWVQTEEWCHSYRGAIKSDMFADSVPLSDMTACTVQLYQTCMLGSFIQIHVIVKCFSIRQEIWYVTNQPDMPTGKVRLPRVCKTYQLPSWTPSWIYQIQILMLQGWCLYQESVKSAFCMRIPGVCLSQGTFSYIFGNKLPFWRPFCLNYYFIFILLL